MRAAYSFGWSEIFYLLTILLFLVSLICSGVVKSRFRRFAKVRPANGLTGAMAAERILRANGIFDVGIAQTYGTLTDNYDPNQKRLNLSEAVYSGTSVSAIAVAAHECGHDMVRCSVNSVIRFCGFADCGEAPERNRFQRAGIISPRPLRYRGRRRRCGSRSLSPARRSNRR